MRTFGQLNRASVGTALITCLVGAGCDSSTGPAQPGPGNPPPLPGPSALAVQQVASGLSSPVYLTAPPADDRMFVVEQAGVIRIIENGQLLPNPFLDIRSSVQSGGEQGLLSMTFDPDYANNGLFYVYYTDNNGDSQIAQYAVSADPNLADANSADILLSVAQPFSNHNGGLVMFGPDNMLYVGLGDGGSGGDPQEHGQNTQTLLGSLLRIDVSTPGTFSVPASNPFANEIWGYGLRNPWRYTFDFATGDLYVADVGQSAREEVNVVPAASGGVNYGWNTMEGSNCFDPPSGCDQSGLQLPVLEYDHGQGCSVTGGFVYRGTAIPGIVGHYFYSDYCSSWLRSFRYESGSATEETEWDVGNLDNVLSFGQDAAGELYILTDDGRVYQLVGAN